MVDCGVFMYGVWASSGHVKGIRGTGPPQKASIVKPT